MSNTKSIKKEKLRMTKIKSRVISLLTMTALIATGTVPQAAAEALNDSSSTPETITESVVDKQNAVEEPAYITGEIVDLRTRCSKTYEKSDGSRVSVVSAAPVHFYDEKSEEWEEYDNRLTYNEDTKNYESNGNGSDMQVSLPEKIDEKNDINVEANGYTVSVTPIDISSSSSKKINEKKNIKSREKDLKEYSLEDYVSDAVLDGKVEYTQDSSAKIEYIFSGSELKENIVLSEIPQKKQTYSFKIKTGGLTAKLQKDNSVKLYDSNNKTVFVIPAPFMYDKSFEFSDEIKTKLKKDGAEYILTYEPDYKWLTDEDRVYPVTIDPTVQTKQSNTYVTDTSVLSASSYNLSGNPNLYAGAMGNRNCVVDSYIKFKRPPVIDKQWIISSAKLNLKTASDKDNKINAYRITSDWETDTVKANPPSVDSTILDVCSVPAESDTWVYWDITNTVYDWYNGGANYGIKLSSPYAQNNQSVFYSADASESENIPYISVEYNTISSAQLENSRSVDIGRAGTATINDFSGNLTLTREDIGVDGNVMPVNISMIYNLNQVNCFVYGCGFKTNYNQMISYTSDSGKNKFYTYICEDGSTVYFDEDEETGEYVDRSERGYTLTNNGTSTNDYVNITVKDSSEYEYHFDKYGRLVKITDTNVNAKPSIEIAYTGDYTKIFEIDYIKDGAGRKYDFNYADGKLSDISYYGNTDTVLKKISYEYVDSTFKVIYPDGKSVSYSWDKNCMTSACNTDNYRVNFEYTSNSVSLPKKVTAIKEYGSNGTKGGDISIDYSPYQTKYTNNSTGDTETLVFNSDGDLISTYNSQGAVTVNEYANSTEFHGVNSLVNTYQHKKSETNLLSNGELERGLSDWSIDGDTDLGWHGDGHPGDKNNSCVQINGTPGQNGSITQEISVSGKAGDTFDVGGWAKANASPQNPFNIVVLFLNNGNISSSETVSFNPYCTDWQYAMKNVQAKGTFTSVLIVLNYSGQINKVYFDGIAVYKAESVADVTEEENTEITEETSEEETEPVTTIGSDGSKTTVDETDGVKTVSVVDRFGNDVSSETIIDGVSLKDISEYSLSGNYLKSTTDSAGTKTSYTYDENTGNLNSVNVHYNPINYTYDNSGNIAKVMQSVSGLANGTAIENSYFYDSGDRLSKIIHNGFNYTFGYTEFGLLESIMAGNQSLINYSYDNNGILTKAQYGNGQTIDYEYNNDNNKAAIKQNGNVLYNYNYDEYGTLTSVTDNVSGRVTSYTTDDNGNTVTEEKGKDVYHKLYSTEDQSVEVVGNDTIITKTASDADWSKTYWESENNRYSTYLTQTDKFGRTSSESLYKISHDSDDKEIAISKQSLYNKKYTYYSQTTGKTSERVGSLAFTGGYNKNFHYGYDAYGNISEVNNIWYVYDEASQLKTEVDVTTGTGKDYIYDKGGNITEVRHFTNGVYGDTDTYTYGNSNWKDLLTAYNGKTITYDEIGNPLTYYNGTKFAWTMGRRLESATRSDGIKISYTYNAEGLRTGKTIRNVPFKYYWNGNKLTGQTWGGNSMYFRYDGDTPIGFEFNGMEYYYVTNLQGDIIAILDSNGTCLAEYEYDAWGNCTVTKDTNTIAYLNPLRYRGYYYDSDTDLYYLQSRYYDANTGRFINADEPALIGANGGMVSNNLFAYCDNNPVMSVDPSGRWYFGIVSPDHIFILSPQYVYNMIAYANRKLNSVLFANYLQSKLAPDGGMINVSQLLSRLPYIYDQKADYIKDMRYGIASFGNVGCEIVATYNLLIAIKRPTMLNSIIAEFELNNMYYGGIRTCGKLGTDPDDLYRYFNAHKIKYSKTKKIETLKKQLAKDKYGKFIIGYWNKGRYSGTIHTVYAIKRKNSNYICVYNYGDGYESIKVDKFIKRINEQGRFITSYKF